MTISYANCDACPLKGCPTVQPSGVEGGFAIIGEAPGKSEAQQGKPFVGMSGKLLRETLQAVGLDPSKLWITNSCLCRPPGNATPSKEAIDACRPRLLAELKEKHLLGVILLGNTACQAMLNTKKGVTQIRGRYYWLEDLGVNAIATYHPAALLRSPDLFRDFASDLERSLGMPDHELEPITEVPYKLCDHPGDIVRMIRFIYKQDPVHLACDLETSTLDETTGEVLAIGIASSPDDIFIIPGDLVYNYPFVKRQLKELLENPDLIWAGQNGYQFDAKWLRTHYDINWQPKLDTMLMHFAIDERQKGHDLKTLARLYFQATDYADDIKSYDSFSDVPVDSLYKYLALDCYYTWKLVPELHSQMVEDDVDTLHDTMLIPTAKTLGEIEQTGVLIDVPYLTKVSFDLENESVSLLADLKSMVGPSFNPNSPVQVLKYLQNELNLKVTSTGEEVIEQIKHPFVTKLLDYRHTAKLKSTYADAILERLDANNRIHCSYKIFGTRTNRISSADPNLQNIPVRVGPLIRDAFIVPEGYTWVDLDFSQLELRVAAFYSLDPDLIEIYQTGQDLHSMVAAAMYKIPLDQVTKAQRQSAKVVDFGILYGKTAKTLANDLSCSVKEGQAFIDAFLGRFPVLRQWIKDQQHRVFRDGYTLTPFGAKRRFPLILDNNRIDILKQGVNTPIQGFAGQICLNAMARIQAKLNPKIARILLTVHDSIAFEVKTEYVPEIIQLVKTEAEYCPIESPVPFTVEIKTGQRWGSLQEVAA